MTTRIVMIAAVLALLHAVAAGQDAVVAGHDSFAQTELFRRLAAAEQRLAELETDRLVSVDDADGETAFMAAADEATLAQRLAALEQAYKKDQDDAARKKADDASQPTVRVGGFLQLDFWGFPETSPGVNAMETGNAALDPQDRLGFRRVRFNVSGDVPDNMLYRIELEVSEANSPTIKDVFLGWKDLPLLGRLLIGNQRRPYGLDYLNSSRYNVFVERPFIVEALNQNVRRLGVASYAVSPNQAWNWRFGVFSLTEIQALGAVTNDDLQPEVAGRLANTLWYDEASGGRGYAHWAVSGSWAFPSTASSGAAARTFLDRPEARTVTPWLNTGAISGLDEYRLLGLEGVLNLGSAQVCGEIMQNWCYRQGPAEDLYFWGAYVYVAYFLTGEHMPWERETGTLGRLKPLENFFCVRDCDGHLGGGWGAWQVAVRYSHGDLTDDGIFGGIGDSLTLGLNWQWNPNARVQLNYLFGRIDERGQPPGSGATLLDGTYQAIGIRGMIDF